MQRQSRISRQSVASAPVPTLEHDAVAVALQEALGARVLLIRTIGEGGMGRVYLARDPQLKRFVAVKVLVHSPYGDVEAQARFQREAQAIAAVSHPNVVAIYGVGELPDGRPYFIMQYVSGGSMAERLQASGPLPVEMAETVIGDVAAALAAAHRRGIIHRDVKPANVLWDEEGERATVSDFGIATLQPTEGDDQDIRITGTGMAVGSPAYMSPEQLLTEPVTPKSDIYALGLLGYELLTARGPYNGNSPAEVVAAHLRDKPRRLSEVRTDIPEALQELLLRCLSKEPEERPTAEEVMQAVTPGAADALEWPPPGLEPLRGALWRLMAMPAIGASFLLLPLLVLLGIDQDFGDSVLVGPALVGASSIIGLSALLRSAVRVWQLARALARAARLRYGVGTMVEVMSDRRSDTGSLISGTREYASLPVGERTTLRVLRVIRALMLFLASPLALLAAISGLALGGSESAGAPRFATLVVATLLGFGGVGIVLGTYEHLRMSASRQRRAERPRRSNERELAPAWYAAFDRSSEGQRFGSGREVSWISTSLLVGAGALIVLFCAGIIFTVSLVTVMGQLLTGLSAPNQLAYLSSYGQRAAGGVVYRTPPADSVTPIEAGEALLAVASTNPGGRNRRSFDKPMRWDYPVWRQLTPPPTLFPKPREMSWTTAAIRAAGTGLTPEQREFIRRAAAHPAREEFARAATARAADVYGARFALPFKRPVAFVEYPHGFLFGLKDASDSYAAMVAEDIAERRPQDAERHARDIIAVGAELIDIPFVSDNVAGFDIVANGVSALESVYIVTGRELQARLLLDSVVTMTNRRSSLLRAGTLGLRAASRDGRFTRGGRMDMMMNLQLTACADPRQLLFGFDDAHKANVLYARDSIARFPSERAWVDAIESTLTNGALVIDGREQSSALTVFASWADWIVGGKRFESCASLYTMFRRIP